MTHPHAAIAERVFASFRRDPRTLASLIAEDAVWTVVGGAPVAGVYEGRRTIFDLFRATQTLTDSTYLAELRWVLADDSRTVVVYRASGRRGDRELDIDQALFVRVEDGRWHEILAVPLDPVAFDSFWA
ncbi:MAG TPA: nuclear transport factor 2 family protein [Gaiellaceae bacterium]|nr:nuclear transport factor 2 family protein [Gaiellaceae bacterium]